MKHDVARVFDLFDILGHVLEAAPYGNGHINDTYAVTVNQAGRMVRYIFQRINHEIFRDPVSLMDNIHRVTTHLATKLVGDPDASRRTLTVLPARTGEPYVVDATGLFWRAYLFIEGARTYDAVENENQALEAARAFGLFQRLLDDLKGPPLFESIPGFHDTPARYRTLMQAVSEDRAGRAKGVTEEIEFFVRREQDAFRLSSMLKEGKLPLRITHNDTKLNNVMLDDQTGEGVCVIDLDTVMPGLALYDFGDLVRTATSPTLEDERNLSLIRMQMPMFNALVRGYIDSAHHFLTETEIAELPFSGKLITLETGIRFLTDYLNGDIYFKTHRLDQNLDRCRTQCALVRSIEDQMDAMQEVVEQEVREYRERARP